MITVTVELPLKPGVLEQYQAVITEMLKDTVNQPGFGWIKIHRSAQGENKVMFIEEWASEEDYRAYLAWRAQGNRNPLMDELVAGPPVIQIWGDVIAEA